MEDSGQRDPQCLACQVPERPEDFSLAIEDVTKILGSHGMLLTRTLRAAGVLLWRAGWRVGVHAGWLAHGAHHMEQARRRAHEMGNMPPHPALVAPAHGPYGGH